MESKTSTITADATNVSIGAASSANGSASNEKMVEKEPLLTELPTPPNLAPNTATSSLPFEPAKVSTSSTTAGSSSDNGNVKDKTVTKKKRNWLSLSPSRRKAKEQQSNDDAKVEDDQTTQESKDPQTNVPLKSAIKKKRPTLVMIEVETVAEGIEEVQLAERRNFARAVSFDDTVEVFDYHLREDKDKDNMRATKKKNATWNSTKPAVPIINPFDIFTADGNLKEGADNKSNKNKWWKKPLSPFRNRSSNKNKKAGNEQDNEDPKMAAAQEEEKEDIPPAMNPKIIMNGQHDDNSNNNKSDWKTLYKTKFDERDDNVPKTNSSWLGQTGFLMIMSFLLLTVVSFCSPKLTTTKLLDSACGPAFPGTILDGNSQEPTVLSLEAPWWAPERVKSKKLFQFVCGDRPRTRLEWQLVKQVKNNNQRLYRLLLVDLDGNNNNNNNGILLDKKNLVQAEIGSTTIVAMDKKEGSHQFQAPWQQKISATK